MESIPQQSRPHDSHTLESDGVRYDVYKLIHLAQETTPVSSPIEMFESFLDEDCWTDTNGARVRPRQVVEMMQQHSVSHELAQHIQRIREADTSHPILLSSEGRVLDGMHRLARLAYEGSSEVATKTLGREAMTKGLHNE